MGDVSLPPIPPDHPFDGRDLSALDTLRDIMAALRDPETGCPWDVEQDFSTIAPCTIEEAYEVVDAIERGHMQDLCEELGDLLLQVVFHSRMASETGAFTLDEVVSGISTKLLRRHPHVFGDEKARRAGAAKGFWDKIKTAEKAAKAAREKTRRGSRLDDVPLPLPALTRAEKLQKRAARVGFDWPDASGPLAKVAEELDELTEAAREGSAERTKEEFGDLLFSMVNLARHYKIDPEDALRRANAKFTGRFAHIETELAERGRSLEQASPEAMERLWEDARERGL